MKIGFLTNSLAWAGCTDLREIGRWAAANGFEDLEVGPNIPLEEKLFQEVIEGNSVHISSFIYCRNFFSADEEEAKRHILAGRNFWIDAAEGSKALKIVLGVYESSRKGQKIVF